MARLMRYLSLLQCPACQGALEEHSASIYCVSCHQSFPIEDGIPLLYWPEEAPPERESVTARIKDFYELNPFPNYDDFDDLASLIDKARQGVFGRLLDEQIPFRTRVLDCGCGTGQLANFLGIAQRSVFGTDICLNSLKLADGFRRQHELERVNFLQMNLFRPVFRPALFDVIICNGVLHHTADPEGGMAGLSRLLKPGGYLLIGLYHRYGRLLTDLRRMLLAVAGPRAVELDPRLRTGELGKDKRDAWFADQYCNPHESKHTVGEVLRWLPSCGLTFCKSIPKTRLGSAFRPDEPLFEPEPPGVGLERILLEMSQVFTEAAENGFFVLIARRDAAVAPKTPDPQLPRAGIHDIP